MSENSEDDAAREVSPDNSLPSNRDLESSWVVECVAVLIGVTGNFSEEMFIDSDSCDASVKGRAVGDDSSEFLFPNEGLEEL